MKPRETFHLYLLIGQSNMAGRGTIEAKDLEVHPRVFSLDRKNCWIPARDPLHFDKANAGVGPGFTFGKKMAEQNPAIRIGLIPCAAGGSPLSVWRPGVFWQQTQTRPYDDAIHRTKLAMKDGVLKGILWHQGEGDATETDSAHYEKRLADLIHELRRDLELPDVPFVAATLGDFFVGNNPAAQTVNDAIQRVPKYIRAVSVVDSKGLQDGGDRVHFNAAAGRDLGRRYAEAMTRFGDRRDDQNLEQE